MRLQYLGVCVVLWVAVPGTAAEYAFVGKWDCEVGIFSFTNRTYNNGATTLTLIELTSVRTITS